MSKTYGHLFHVNNFHEFIVKIGIKNNHKVFVKK